MRRLLHIASRIYWEAILKKRKSGVLSAFFLIATLFCVRVGVRHYLDGTIWYDRVAVYYTMTLSAFCIFYIFACLFEKEPPRFVQWFSKISFEVYLYHYMFCVGPLRIFGLTPFWITDCLLVTVIAVILAGVMNKAADLLLQNGAK